MQKVYCHYVKECVSGWQVTLIFVSTFRRVKRVFMSMRACLVSLYTVPRKLRGRESWKSRPFTITRSPTVMVPMQGQKTTKNSIVTFMQFWMQDLKNIKVKTFSLSSCTESRKSISTPLWFHFLHQGKFYFIFMPLFHACSALFSFTILLSSVWILFLVSFSSLFEFVLRLFLTFTFFFLLSAITENREQEKKKKRLWSGEIFSPPLFLNAVKFCYSS